jgi:hypothetical protein
VSPVDATWLGLDPAVVHDLERALAAAARAVRRLGGSARANTSRVPWSGADRQRALRTLARVDADAHTVAERLDRAAGALRRDRESQERCSRADGTPLRTELRALTRRWAATGGAATLDQLHNRPDPAAARGWWDGLSAGQQSELLDGLSGALTGVAGLPAAVLAEAGRRHLAERAAELVTSERAGELGLALHVPLEVVDVELGGSLRATTTTFRDGHVEVTVAVLAEVGASARAGRADVAGLQAGEVEQTYRFGSRAVARRFLDGLRASLTPGPSGLLAALSPVAMVVGALQGGSGVNRHLDRHRQQLDTTTVTGTVGVRAELDLPNVAAARVDGAGGASVTTRRDGTSSTTLLAAGAVSLEALGSGVQGELTVGLRAGSDGSRHLLLSGDVKGRAGLRSLLELASPTAQLGTRFDGRGAVFEAEVDLRGPAAGLVRRVTADPTLLADRHVLASLLDDADLVVRTTTIEGRAAEIDLVVVEAGASSTTASTDRMWVKPPNGGLLEVR